MGRHASNEASSGSCRRFYVSASRGLLVFVWPRWAVLSRYRGCSPRQRQLGGRTVREGGVTPAARMVELPVVPITTDPEETGARPPDAPPVVPGGELAGEPGPPPHVVLPTGWPTEVPVGVCRVGFVVLSLCYFSVKALRTRRYSMGGRKVGSC